MLIALPLEASFTVVPMLLVDRLHEIGLSTDLIVLAGALVYIAIRFGLAEILKRIKDPQFAGEVKYIQSNFVQGIREMPIRFEKV